MTSDSTHDASGQLLPRTRLARLLCAADGWTDVEQLTLPVFGARPYQLVLGPRGIPIVPDASALWPAWMHYSAQAAGILEQEARIDREAGILAKLATKNAA